MAQIITSQHIYIYTVKLKTGPRFWGLKLRAGPSSKLQTGPSFCLTVFPHFYSVLGVIFENTNSVTLCQNSVFAKFGDVKNEVFEKKIAFFVFCLFYVGEVETEKRKTNKMEKAKKPYKNRFFGPLSCKNVRNQNN